MRRQVVLTYIQDADESEADFMQEVQAAQGGPYACLLVWDLDQELRKTTKYASDETPEAVVEYAEKLRDLIRDSARDYGIHHLIFK